MLDLPAPQLVRSDRAAGRALRALDDSRSTVRSRARSSSEPGAHSTAPGTQTFQMTRQLAGTILVAGASNHAGATVWGILEDAPDG